MWKVVEVICFHTNRNQVCDSYASNICPDIKMSVHTKSIMNSMEFVMFFASIVGVRLTNPDFRFNKYTFCTVLVISTFLFSGCYSIIINRHDLFLILETLCAWGLVIPVIYILSLKSMLITNINTFISRAQINWLYLCNKPKNFDHFGISS